MPWKRTDVFEERVRFALSSQTSVLSMSAQCAQAGISRECGYKWLKRYGEGGIEGLRDLSRAPHHRAPGVPEGVIEAAVALRQERPLWGPRKLLAQLRERNPELPWPAVSTLGEVLRQRGLVAPRRRQRRSEPRERPFAAVEAPNDEWAIDFKGWFRTASGERCDPLTVSDMASRYLLQCRIMPLGEASVRAACEALFREYGLPLRMRSDNGPPFGSQGPAGLTRLSVWWVKLAIEPVLIRPGCPQDNGRHERLHGTLQGEVGGRPLPDRVALQAEFDRFRRDYNEERPHEALGQIPPGRVWHPSARPYPARVMSPWYDARHQVRQVHTRGEIGLQGHEVLIGKALVGEPVGLQELESGDWLVRFASIDLGVIDRRSWQFHRYAAARPRRRVAVAESENETRIPSAMPPV